MVSIIIVILLILAYRYGFTKGIMGLIVRVASFILVALLAGVLSHRYGPVLAAKLPRFSGESQGVLANLGLNLNEAFYQLILFWLFTIGLGILVRMMLGPLTVVANLPGISLVNRVLGGLVTSLLMYGVLFLILLLLSSWPNENVRASVTDSTLAQIMLEKTPVVSNKILKYWLSELNA